MFSPMQAAVIRLDRMDSMYTTAKRRKISRERALRRWSDPKARKVWLDGIRSQARRKKIGKHSSKMWRDPEYQEKQHQSRVRAWKDPARMAAHQHDLKKRYKDPEYRERLAQTMRDKWKNDPDYNKRQLAVVRKTRKKLADRSIMTGLEKHCAKMLSKFGYDYCFNGSRPLIRSYKPDFVHSRFKRVIEVNGPQHHDMIQQDRHRIAQMRKDGWKVLVLWYYELSDEARTKKKLRRFHSR